MFKLVIVGTIVALSKAAVTTNPINSQIVADIRERTHRWVAHDVESNPLKNRTLASLNGLLGTITRPEEAFQPFDINYADPQHVAAVPENFDWRA